MRFEWGALTDAERHEFMALMDQRRAHGEEKLEALGENLLVLRLLFAYQEEAITALEFVERVRGAVPDPLAQNPGLGRATTAEQASTESWHRAGRNQAPRRPHL